MKVLLLDNYDSFTYNLAQLLEESGLCDYEIVKNDKINFEQVEKFDKILLSPGAGVPSKAGKMPELIEKYHKNKPILGICLGMQAIAEFFGGELYNMRQVYHGIKQKIKIEREESIFSGLDEYEFVGLYHSWAVSKYYLPKDLKITAVSTDGIVMALSHTKYNVKGVQFHPESYITYKGKIIIENWLKG